MKIPRLMLAAPASGSGKTLITCGLLQAFQNRKQKPVSFKCGPDYIDPMFHTRVIGTKSRNLDSFLSAPDTVRMLLRENAEGCGIVVLEGVMGYYDGIAGVSTRASAYEIASITDTPVILIINAAGISLSAAALVRGFLHFREDSHICGVILNQISPMLYPRMKEQIEKETGIRVFGYVPKLSDCVIESRHLGLLMPEEIEGFQQKIRHLGEVLEKSIEIDELLQTAQRAPEISNLSEEEGIKKLISGGPLRIGVARDEAFCFFYEDNLELLKKMGAQLVEFSPLHDTHLPENICGLLLNGGYPELYAEELSNNHRMLREIAEGIRSNLPVMAECGGFMYLQNSMESKKDHKKYPMAGVIDSDSFDTGRLSRFGYVTLSGGKVFGEEVGEIPAHEFHHYDSAACGEAFLAEKPLCSRSWKCMYATDTMLAGFPHLYYYGNRKVPEAFLKACWNFKERG